MPRVQWPRRRDGSGHHLKHALSGRSHQIRSQAAGPDAALYEQIDLGQGSGGHRGVLEIGAEGPGPENDSLIESTIKKFRNWTNPASQMRNRKSQSQVCLVEQYNPKCRMCGFEMQESFDY